MGAVREEAVEGQFLLSPPTASRKMAAPTPTVAAAAGTLIYLNSYGDTAAHAEALASDEEVDIMPDGTRVKSRSSKGSKSADPEATQRSKGSKSASVEASIRSTSIRSKGGKGSKSASAESSIISKGGKSASAEASIVGILHSPSDQIYGTSEKSDSDFSVAAGLEFSDDEDFLDLHVDSDDGLRSSFPKDTRPKTLILGGPLSLLVGLLYSILDAAVSNCVHCKRLIVILCFQDSPILERIFFTSASLKKQCIVGLRPKSIAAMMST